MARHSHAVNVRADGLETVLGPLVHDPALLAALLVDVDSGMVLDGWTPRAAPDTAVEEVGAAHAELMRIACTAATVLAPGADPAEDTVATSVEVVIDRSPGRHVVVRGVADPYGDRLALSVLVDGSPRAVRRVRRRLGAVSTAALTAGPTLSLRPRDGAWVPGAVERQEPVVRSRRAAAPRPPAAPPSVPVPPIPVQAAPALAALDAGRATADAASGAALFTPVRDAVTALPAPPQPRYAGRPAPPAALPPPTQG
jgi:hypothetical protein